MSHADSPSVSSTSVPANNPESTETLDYNSGGISPAPSEEQELGIPKDYAYIPQSEVGNFLVKYLRHFTLPFLILFPVTFIALTFGLVPLGDPDGYGMGDQAVFVFLFNPLITTAVGYLHGAVFLAALGYPRPFRISAYLWVINYCAQVLMFGPMIPHTSCFKFLGAVALVWTLIVVFVTLAVHHSLLSGSERRNSYMSKFLVYIRVVIAYVLYVIILTGFIFAFRYANSLGQRFLAPALVFVLFLLKIIVLAMTDSLGIEVQMLVSGLWLQNISDVVQTVAFPYVIEPSTFAIFWAANFVQSIALLVFLFNWWMSVRLWLKHNLMHVFSCRFPIPPVPEIVETDDLTDRGHGVNRQGYQRRVIRFFFWRLVSQATAMLFYLTFTPILRYGFNNQHFPISKDYLAYHLRDAEENLSEDEYRNSMIYSAANLIVCIISGLVGDWIIRKVNLRAERQIRVITRNNLSNLTYVGIVIAIFTSNILVAMSIILEHYKIWFAF